MSQAVRETYLIKLRNDIFWLDADKLHIYWMAEKFKPEPGTKMTYADLRNALGTLIQGARFETRPSKRVVIPLTDEINLAVHFIRSGTRYRPAKILAVGLEHSQIEQKFSHFIRIRPDIIGVYRDHYVTLAPKSEPIRIGMKRSGIGAVSMYFKSGQPFFSHYSLAYIETIQVTRTGEEYEEIREYVEHTYFEGELRTGHLYRKIDEETFERLRG